MHTGLVYGVTSFKEDNNLQDSFGPDKDPSNNRAEEQIVSHGDDATVGDDDGRLAVSHLSKEFLNDKPNTIGVRYNPSPAVRMPVGLVEIFAVSPLFGIRYGEYVQQFIEDGHAPVNAADAHKLSNADNLHFQSTSVEKELPTNKCRGVLLKNSTNVGPTSHRSVCKVLRLRLQQAAPPKIIPNTYSLFISKDRKLHLVLWRVRSEENHKIKTIMVPFGDVFCRYHASQPVQYASRISGMGEEVDIEILRDYKVDDELTGAASVVGAQSLMQGILDRLLIHQCASSEASITRSSAEDLRMDVEVFHVEHIFPLDHTFNTHQVTWLPDFDHSTLQVNSVQFKAQLLDIDTTRELLSALVLLLELFEHISKIQILTFPNLPLIRFVFDPGIAS